MKKNPLPASVFDCTKQTTTDTEDIQKTTKITKHAKRKLTITLNNNTFLNLWEYCGKHNKRMNKTIEDALLFFFQNKGEK